MLTEENLLDEVNRLVSTKGDFISNLLKNNQRKPIAIGKFPVASMLPGHLYLLIWKDPYHVWSSVSFKYVISNDFIEQSYLVDFSEPPNDSLVANYQYGEVISLETSWYPSKTLTFSETSDSVMYEFGSTGWLWNTWSDENLVVYDLTSSIFLGIPSLNFPQGVIF